MEIYELIKPVHVKYLVKHEKNLNEIIEISNIVYRDNALKKTTIFKWIKRFNKGFEGCKDNVR